MGIDFKKDARHWAVLMLLFVAGLLAGVAVAHAYSFSAPSDLEKVSREVEALEIEVHQIASDRNVSGQEQAAEILKRHLASFSPNERSVLEAFVKQIQRYQTRKNGPVPIPAMVR